MATESELRDTVATWGNAYKGIAEGSSAHKELINIFNNSGLCTRYKMTVNDAWCALFVSDAFIVNNLTSIFPCVECSCSEMVSLAKKAGIWVEDDSYTPSKGDVIMYDWDDGGSGDNTGTPDHVGIVQKISGTSMTVIEGNKSDTVGTRSMTVNGKYIRGYITPNYASVTSTSTATSSEKAAMTETVEEGKIWTYLMDKIGNAYGTAGLMGNLYAESALLPINLQNSYESKLGYTDKTYTEAVDNGSYTKFSSDSAGYGLAQWTYSTRKKALKTYCDGQNASIGNLDAQLGYLWQELQNDFSSVLSTLKSATSVKTASNAVLTKFECPADQGSSVQSQRTSYGQTYYDKYASSSSGSSSTGSSGSGTSSSSSIDYAESFDKSIAGTYTVTASSGLNLRTGASTSKASLAVMPKGSTVKNYGYYTKKSGVKWLLVEYVSNSQTYTGFCSSEYLSGGSSGSSSSKSTNETNPLYYVHVTISNLNIRAGAGTNYAVKGTTGIGVFGITAEKTGKLNSGTGTFGKLLSGAGYIWLGAEHVTKM